MHNLSNHIFHLNEYLFCIHRELLIYLVLMKQQCHSTRIKSVVFNYLILCSKKHVSSKSVTVSVILILLLMAEFLHRLICSLSHYLQGLYFPGGAGFLPSTVGPLNSHYLMITSFFHSCTGSIPHMESSGWTSMPFFFPAANRTQVRCNPWLHCSQASWLSRSQRLMGLD